MGHTTSVLSVKDPTSNSLNADIIKWLDEYNILFNPYSNKHELYELIKVYSDDQQQFKV